jgi:crossover junction endodeoxyribonuclease RuvC
MKILGIDPGLAIVGYAVIDFDGKNITLLNSGSIQTSKNKDEPNRLLEIMEDISAIIEKYKPDTAAIEKLFYFKNQKTVMPVSQARGVILAVLAQHNIRVFEYTPIEVKQVLTGYGRASKPEVEQMVKLTLNADKLPKLDDTIDAIAIAICHSRQR